MSWDKENAPQNKKIVPVLFKWFKESFFFYRYLNKNVFDDFQSWKLIKIPCNDFEAILRSFNRFSISMKKCPKATEISANRVTLIHLIQLSYRFASIQINLIRMPTTKWKKITTFKSSMWEFGHELEHTFTNRFQKEQLKQVWLGFRQCLSLILIK